MNNMFYSNPKERIEFSFMRIMLFLPQIVKKLLSINVYYYYCYYYTDTKDFIIMEVSHNR